ncbi:MAG TPA: hypothetical protein VFD92_04130 [Candidatus Binatia bacterium]|nr:hypothetical protein [Candidatus Binatia bacterium]
MDAIGVGSEVSGWLAALGPFALVGAGVPLLASGVRRWARVRQEARDPERALLIALGFRRAIIGLCALVFGLAWMLSVGWLMAIAAIVVGEETLESSVLIAALRDGARARRPATTVGA